MANLCLEDVQFLNETALDGFNFILDEFSNEYNYLQNIDEVSISDSINTAINKLKELWKSFMEWVKDVIRKVKVKMMQLMAKLKHNKNRAKNSKSELLLPTRSKTTEDEEYHLTKEEIKRRMNNIDKHYISNNEVIETKAADKVITIDFYSSFTKNNFNEKLAKRVADVANDHFDKLCGRIFLRTKDVPCRDIGSSEYDIFYEILDFYFNRNHNNTNYTFDENKSINENIHNALLGENKEKIKVILNNDSGYDTNKIINSYLSSLNEYYDILDNISKDLNNYVEKVKEEKDVEDKVKISAIADMQRITKVVKDIIKSAIDCDLEVVLMFYKILNHWLYNEYGAAPNATLCKYVKFEKA